MQVRFCSIMWEKNQPWIAANLRAPSMQTLGNWQKNKFDYILSFYTKWNVSESFDPLNEVGKGQRQSSAILPGSSLSTNTRAQNNRATKKIRAGYRMKYSMPDFILYSARIFLVARLFCARVLVDNEEPDKIALLCRWTFPTSLSGSKDSLTFHFV